MRRPRSVLSLCLLMAACEGERVPAHLNIAGGDPGEGRAIIAARGCTACHQIPGVRTPAGFVGPPLTGFGRRAYVAGRLPNRPAVLTSWLRDPPALDPQTAMPSVGLDDNQARHVAAYLYTLR